MFSKLPFSKFKNFIRRSVLGELQLTQISLNCNFLLKIKNHLSFGLKSLCDIRSNLRAAQNGRFVISPAYPGGGTLVPKILDFRPFESLIKCTPQNLWLS